MMLLLDLPSELLLAIAGAVESTRDLGAFSRTCRRIINLTDPRLYLLDVQKFGASALFWASTHGQVETARKSLAQGANVRAKLEDGSQPLSLAARNGHETVMRLLFGQGARTNCQDAKNRTPLLEAAAAGHEAAVSLLLEQASVERNTEDNDGGDPPSFPPGTGRFSLLDLPPLWHAANNGHDKVVELLLADEHVDPECTNILRQTPLSCAVKNEHEAVVKLLLSRDDVDPNSSDISGFTPMWYAARSGSEALVRLLLEKGGCAFAPASNGWPPISMAAGPRDMKVFEILLEEYCVSPNHKDSWGRTALSWAAEMGCTAVVRRLLALGTVELNSKEKNGRTPLLLAAENEHEEVVRLLLAEETIDPDSEDVRARTPLSIAVKRGHENIANMLTSRGASIFDVSTSGDDFLEGLFDDST